MKVYTRRGDAGSTGLLGGERVRKDDTRIECLGTVDEVVASIGLLRAELATEHPWQKNLQSIQRDLMNMMSHLAAPKPLQVGRSLPELPERGAEFCESWIDHLEEELGEPSQHFLLPGGTRVAALCHVVRTQARTAERRLAALMDGEDVDALIPAYLNRLSDLFFVLSRAELASSDMGEERWRLFIYRPGKTAAEDDQQGS